ncbi:putative Ig domain-containing protein, partial [Cellulomonas citrea]|uniref:putative Ig domain-containing protein n=1 Tax=Cellulomonas citrea TaxID=1909423 RepID=UPI001359ACA7
MRHRHHPAHRAGRRAPRLAAALVGALALTPLLTTVAGPASAVQELTVTGTSRTGAAAGTATALTGLAVTGGTSVSATLSTSVGTLTFHDTTSATLAYGNSWSGDSAVTVTGTPAQVDAALGAVDLVLPAGTSGQHAAITLSAYEASQGAEPVVYSPTNGHYYQFFPNSPTPTSYLSWSQARAAAATSTFAGQNGYLATIPNDDVNQLITSKIPGAENVWIGARSIDDPDDTNGDGIYRTWVWVDGPLANKSFTLCNTWEGDASCGFVAGADLSYQHWKGPQECMDPITWDAYPCWFEPNNSQGSENVAVTNWGGYDGFWNDLPDSASAQASGYVVEYGDQATGGSFTIPSSTVSLAIFDVPSAPQTVTAQAGDAQATVSFTAPSSDGGSAVVDYVVTSSGGQSATCASSPCVVTGLTNGTGYTFTVVARNVAGSSPASDASATVTPQFSPAPPTAVSGTLPTLVTGTEMSTTTLTADGYPAPTFSVTAGSLPAGLSLDASTGQITGTPTAAGAYSVTITASNAHGSAVTHLSGTVLTPTTQVSGTMPVLRTGTAASVSLTADGDPVPTFAVSAGSLPAGLSLDTSTGQITGTPTAAGPYSFSVTATNTYGHDTAAFVGSVQAATTSLTGTIPAATVGTPLSTTLTADGYPTPTFSVTAGALPAGLSLDAVTGVISGTPTAAGPYDVTVTATNTDATHASVHLTGAVSAATTTASGTMPDAVAGTALSMTVTADGYPAPTFAVTSGALPAGLSLDGATGVVSGTPTTAGGYSFTVTATNVDGSSAQVSFTGTVDLAAPGAPTGVTATPGDGAATVTFTPPTFTGGAPVDGYQVSTDGGQTWTTVTTTASGSTRTATVTGLTNGQTYSVKVRAFNEAGGGAASSAVSTRPIAPPPAAVAAPTVVNGTSSATISWVASTAPGVTGYTVTAHPGDATCTTSSATATSCIVGAAAGTSTTYTVVVHSIWGDSPASAPSQPVAAVAPEIPSAPPADASVVLTTTQGVLSQVAPAQQITVVGSGFAPYSTARVVVYSTPVLLAEVLVGADGTFSAPVTLPNGLEAGAHTLVAYGVDPQGAEHTLSMPVTYAADAPTGAASLAATGADVLPLLVLGLACLVLGVGALRLRSRR